MSKISVTPLINTTLFKLLEDDSPYYYTIDPFKQVTVYVNAIRLADVLNDFDLVMTLPEGFRPMTPEFSFHCVALTVTGGIIGSVYVHINTDGRIVIAGVPSSSEKAVQARLRLSFYAT